MVLAFSDDHLKASRFGKKIIAVVSLPSGIDYAIQGFAKIATNSKHD
jgi:hypothetical protein